MPATAPCAIPPETLARLKTRLAELVEEYLRESDPSKWTPPANATEQTRRYYEKRHAEVTLKQITELSRTIAAAEGLPDPKPSPETKETASKIKAARQKAKELREQAGIEEATH
jgi:hypothetical protein